MAERTLRRGLPRVSGGDPWPPELSVDVADAGAGASASVEAAAPDAATALSDALAAPETATTASATTPAATIPPVPTISAAEAAALPAMPAAPAPEPGSTSASTASSPLRRGLPRVAGGDPWPPAGAASTAADPGSVASSVPAVAAAGAADETPAAPAPTTAVAAEPAPASTQRSAGVRVRFPGSSAANGAPLRRGLPRVAGGDPWPPEGLAHVRSVPAGSRPAEGPGPVDGLPVVQAQGGAAAAAVAEPDSQTVAVQQDAAPAAVAAFDVSTPLTVPRTVWNGTAPRRVAGAVEEGARRRPTWPQAIAGLLAAAGLGILAAAAVAFVRAFLSLPFMQDFLAAFPGEYHPAFEVEAGFAPWIGWQHFFNMFLMVLIIRSGLRVRTEKRPTAFWTPRGNDKGKISLTLWFHQSLDILWLVNGAIFIVLLFVTGHWIRLVPTSWEVFPNALSAALQYVSFDWPTENGWVNYNSLQQLAYFVTVFIAAPLAAITGFRMSGMWPKKAEKLSKAYPIEWARAVHFPVMLYFVLFIIAHVALVMLTGMLRNLNHMFASNDAVSWTGFWVFIAALVAIVIGWIAARPFVLAPIAKLFGSVSSR
ncbi:hypothetical protein GCM10025768_05770 [Microbacterium pseudoresistens]|uniref:cytochrome b/b6 domain-containing protein n=1 Tax=Microbacterium pseudoresistens TaxID=640634 RepID=UPI0031F11B0E